MDPSLQVSKETKVPGQSEQHAQPHQPLPEQPQVEQHRPKEEKIVRPSNAFFIWEESNRSRISELPENQGLNNHEINTAIGVAWKELIREQRLPYQTEANKLRSNRVTTLHENI
jgi:hypothetical protein